jgi:hypothetical protein
MPSGRSLLATILRGTAASVLAVVAAIPAVADFHVLARSHGDVHALLAYVGGGDLRVATTCGQDRARHFEAGTTHVVPSCAACLQRTSAPLPPTFAVLPQPPLLGGQPVWAHERQAGLLVVSIPFSRGPPRA